jgi:hypothetical protein
MITPSRSHSLKRTSPIGEAFAGTCTLCGTPNLTFADMNSECPNQRGLTQDDALLEAIARTTPQPPVPTVNIEALLEATRALHRLDQEPVLRTIPEDDRAYVSSKRYWRQATLLERLFTAAGIAP